MKHVVMFSGGAISWATAKRVAAASGTDDLTLLFADTRMEDEDLYRFLREAAANVGGHLEVITEGRTPWQVFRDERFLGNSRVDPCSRILKRDFMRAWIEEHFDPSDTTIYLGLDWTESHRAEKLSEHWSPWRVETPMMDRPFLDRDSVLAMLVAEGIEPPRLYGWGMPHNNCGGFCIKAGQTQFARLLDVAPERYAWHEAQEEALRQDLGKDVAIMRDRTGGTTTPLTMRAFRERIEAGRSIPVFDWGGCGCMDPGEAAAI